MHAMPKAQDDDESNSPFRLGDVVVLKSGGPHMTVEKVTEDGVEVMWFSNGELSSFGAQLQTGVLRAITLKRISE